MLIDIVMVTPFPDFTLELEYANLETRCFDAKPLLTIKPWIALSGFMEGTDLICHWAGA